MRFVWGLVAAAAVAMSGCSKPTGLTIEAPYASLETVKAVLSQQIREHSFTEIPIEVACPDAPDFKGFCTVLRAQEKPYEQNSFLVRLEVSQAQNVLNIYIGRNLVANPGYTVAQQTFAKAVWTALKERGVSAKIKHEEENLGVS